jgi:nucleotide-binding universal stress UspA family protein
MVAELQRINSILVTTDLSPEAQCAFGMAASLMQAYGCSLTLLTCINTSPQYSEASLGAFEAPIALSPQTVTDTYNELEQSLKESLSDYFKSSRANYHIIQAPVAVEHSIVTYITDNEPGLVVMSSHGRSGIRRAFLGSVTEYVLRHCKVPVLVVPIKAR